MRKLSKEKALVLFSGGQDSAISLAWALDRYRHVETIGFDYNQRHNVELGLRIKIRSEYAKNFPQYAERIGRDRIVRAKGIGDLASSAMTSEENIEFGEDGIPTTFLPGRNLMFMLLASSYAYDNDIGVIIAGMCQVDYSGYPDCRAETLDTQMKAIQLGMECDIELQTPLLNETKAESWRIAESLGGPLLVDLINEHSHSCYLGIRTTRHSWGYGCGECPACELREKGWSEYQAGH